MSDERNQETLNVIIDHMDKHGYPPSVRDLAKALDLSVGGAHDRLRDLIDAGLVRQVGPRKLLVLEDT